MSGSLHAHLEALVFGVYSVTCAPDRCQHPAANGWAVWVAAWFSVCLSAGDRVFVAKLNFTVQLQLQRHLRPTNIWSLGVSRIPNLRKKSLLGVEGGTKCLLGKVGQSNPWPICPGRKKKHATVSRLVTVSHPLPSLLFRKRERGREKTSASPGHESPLRTQSTHPVSVLERWREKGKGQLVADATTAMLQPRKIRAGYSQTAGRRWYMVLRPHAGWALPKMDRYCALTWLFSARHWLKSNFRFLLWGAVVVLKEDLKTIKSTRQSNVRACASQLRIFLRCVDSPLQTGHPGPGLHSAAGPPEHVASGAARLCVSQGVSPFLSIPAVYISGSSHLSRYLPLTSNMLVYSDLWRRWRCNYFFLH